MTREHHNRMLELSHVRLGLYSFIVAFKFTLRRVRLISSELKWKTEPGLVHHEMRWDEISYCDLNAPLYHVHCGCTNLLWLVCADVKDDCSEHVCDAVRCYNGGSCVVTGPDSAACLCPLGVAGPRCQSSKSSLSLSLSHIGASNTLASHRKLPNSTATKPFSP